MEKYCKKCGRAFDDLNFKLCPYCGSELSTRYGRQPIPRKLRHEVFKRDGYRCRECGASKEETSLEIDHILPVAKGGTNDIDNLQTLCRECNRMKHTDEWVGGERDLEVVQNELNNLEEQLQIAKNDLNNANDDEKLNYEYEVVKLKEDINRLIELYDKKEKEVILSKKLDEEKELAYKKLYIDLDNKSINALRSYFDISKNKSEVLKYAIKYVIEKGLFDQLYKNFDLNFINNNQKLFSDSYYDYFDLKDNFNNIDDYYNEVKEYVTEEEFYLEMSNSIGYDDISKAEEAMKNILHNVALSVSLERDFKFPIYFIEENMTNISIVGRVHAISDVLEYDVSADDTYRAFKDKKIHLLLEDCNNSINVEFSNPSRLENIKINDLIQINDVKIEPCYNKNFKTIYSKEIVDQKYIMCKSFKDYSTPIEGVVNENSSIIKLNPDYCPNSHEIVKKVNSIIQTQIDIQKEKIKREQIKQEEIRKEIEKKNKERARKEKLFQQLDADLSAYSISVLSSYYNVEDKSKLLNLLVDNFDSEEAIFNFIKEIVENKKCKKTKKLLMKSPVHINSLLNDIFETLEIEIDSKSERIKYLTKNYSEKELKKLITRSENRVINAKLKKLNEKRLKAKK